MEKISAMAGAFYLTFCFVASLNISTIDESSLLAIKSQIDSDILSKNWSQHTSFCTWIGVSCSRRRPRVTALDLPSHGLRGSIAPEIGNLSFLAFLNINNNSLSGSIPEEIGKLRRLRVLDLSMNKLSDQIPSSIGLLRKLEILQISSNYLTGNIPQSLSACQQLTTLDLAGNNLTGNIPSSLGNLSRLQELTLQYNLLTGELPPAIFNISSLVSVSLGVNQLSGRIPEEICRESSDIEILWLDYNQFVGEFPSSLLHCHSLSLLSLEHNNFTGEIPIQFWNLSSIQKIGLSMNGFTGTLPPSIGNLSNLEIFDVSYNSFYGTIPSEIGTLSSLTWLHLGNNHLHGEIPPSIFNLSTLEVLALTSNNLSGALPLFLDQGIPNIQSLYLDLNQFNGTIPNSISNLSNLEFLDLSNNSFSGYVPITLGNLRQLQYLNLGSNYLMSDLTNPEQDFLSSLTTCNYLYFIEISGNLAITGALPKSLGSGNLSESLETFLTQLCNITGHIPDGIGNLSKLIWLDLGGNGLSGAVPTTVGYLSNLQKLELGSNQLHGPISHFVCNLTNLYYIVLSVNFFNGHLPSCLGSLSFLEKINFGLNAFTSNIPSAVGSAENVQVLVLAENFFDGSLPQELGNLDSLTELDLSGNLLSGEIPSTISQLQNLNYLSLSTNHFNGPILDSIAPMTSLQHLDLSVNNISGTIPESLEALLYLNYFNVSFNNLSGEIPDTKPFVNFPAEFFAGNEGLCGAPRFKVKMCRSSSSSTPTPPRKKKSMEHIITRAILAPVAVIVAVFILILVLILRSCGRKSSTTSFPNLPVLPTHKRISHREILEATRNFHEENLIGRGGIGSVYKGVFSDAMVAAVKVFNLEIQDALKSFEVECRVLSSVRHRNLVEVITSCSNLDFKAVLMAYMPNGNLERWLYSPDCSLNLGERVGIMIDVASALEYLQQWHTYPIVHCDIKPSNILLDEDMVAHVADFGIAKLLTEEQRMQLTTTLGTIGYMAPEYGSEGLVSSTVDVYSYGVLLMEALLRRKPTDAMFAGELNMKRWVLESFPDSVMEIVDGDLVSNSMDDLHVKDRHERCLISCVELALECTADLGEERPEMRDVAARMRKIKLSLLAS